MTSRPGAFDESQHPRGQGGRFTTRPAGAPAASLDQQPPGDTRPARSPSSRTRARGVRIGVVRHSPALVPAQEATSRARKDLETLGRRERALRRALVERELLRAGAEKARVSVETGPNRVVVASVQARPGRTVDKDALAAALSVAGQDMDGQERGWAGSGQDGWGNLDEALEGPGRAWFTATARDRVDQAQEAYDRAAGRLRESTSRAVTALCLEAERQGAHRLDVEDGGVCLHTTGQGLALEDGQPADLGDTLPDSCVRDLPGVHVSEEEPYCWSVDVDQHLDARDVQVPGQTYLRI